MELIQDLIERDLSRQIEEIIKVYQDDEQTIYEEIAEYVPTDNIKEQLADTLVAIAKSPQTHQKIEKMGLWISGFFGSGKSSFAKNLGLILSNPQICGSSASELFKKKFNDQRISSYIDNINARIPAKVIMFDIANTSYVRKGGKELISEVMYRSLLENLGYSKDFDIAELEIWLEKTGRYDDFLAAYNELYQDVPWEEARNGAEKIGRASAVMHQLDPATYPDVLAWRNTVRGKSVDFSVEDFVTRVFELSERRLKGKSLFFVIDEVGQYVGRSDAKLEDLRVIIEGLGKESKNRLKRGEIIAPVWVIVTSQERLQDVINTIDEKNVKFPRLLDRFFTVDLSPEDIREVATRRVLSKKEEAKPILEKIYRDSHGKLLEQCHLERTPIRSDITEEDFVQFYPYLPHFINLSIKIMDGIRRQPGATRHIGGSNRTIIKQAYEMLVSERTNLAAKPVGTLVALDDIYELVEGSLQERRSDIAQIAETFPDDGGWALRVAKTISLLEFVREVPRTTRNIAAVMLKSVDESVPTHKVEEALKRLSDADFIKSTEEGWKLQSAEEKNWGVERRRHLNPKPADRITILHDVIGDIVADTKLKNYQLKKKNFKVEYSVDGVRIGDPGIIPVSIVMADSPLDIARKIEAVEDESRLQNKTLFWVMALTPEIDDLVAQYHASHWMVEEFARLAAQNKISNVERDSLESEKQERSRIRSRLNDKITEALMQGTGIFSGRKKDSSSFGNSLSAVFRGFFEYAVPELFPKFEMGAVKLKGDEAAKLLKAENLNGLPPVFYEGEDSLSLVIRDGQNYVLNPEAPIAKEIFGRIHHAKEYGGERETGRKLEQYFSGFGYGWDTDVLKVVLAALFRAGMIEVLHEGKVYRNYADPQARVPFINNIQFRNAGFVERTGRPPLKALVRASDLHREIEGVEVDIDEAKIVSAFKALAAKYYDDVLELRTRIRSYILPVGDVVDDYFDQLSSIKSSDPNDTFTLIDGYGTDLLAAHRAYLALKRNFTPACLEAVSRARKILHEVAPQIDVPEASEALAATLSSPTFYEQVDEIVALSDQLVATFQEEYEAAHQERRNLYLQAIEEVTGDPDFAGIGEGDQKIVLSQLKSVGCTDLRFSEEVWRCATCRASLGQMHSDIAAVAGRTQEALAKVQELLVKDPEIKTQRLRLSASFPSRLDSKESVELAVGALKEELLKLIDEGIVIIPE
ncbi:MAG: BREX system P-loop protein BrxC [Methanomicrobiales archaeon]|nr:BREX system P-loop protein BrxC [Methanomicrobiales archaeon]